MQCFTIAIHGYAGSDVRLSLLDNGLFDSCSINSGLLNSELANRAPELSSAVVAQSAFDALLAKCEQDYEGEQDPDEPRLTALGQALFQFLDTHLAFAARIASARALCVFFKSERGWNRVPWEILHNGDNFLANHPSLEFHPIRLATGASYFPLSTQNRPLQALFMAASPQGVEPLDYEEEEAKLIAATAKHPMELAVEGSGSLAGLSECLEAAPENYDVLHITGHAGLKQGSCWFMLENELGELACASTQALMEMFFRINAHPGLLFLSGCNTAQAANLSAMASMAQQLADEGVTSVCGWGKPVSDDEATAVAEVVYGELAKGASVAKAIHQARRQLLRRCGAASDWHLLRCFGRRESLQPLVTKLRQPGRRAAVYQRPSTAYLGSTAYLDSNNSTRICEPQDYRGNRRLLQRCLRRLKTPPGPASAKQQALLLCGPPAAGKSSTARKLVSRLSSLAAEVVAIEVLGELDEPRLINALVNWFGDANTVALLNQAASLSYRLRLFFQAQPQVVLVFDDFHQNQSYSDNNAANAALTPPFKAPARQVLQAVMAAIRDSGGLGKLIITSRDQPPLPQGLAWHIETMPARTDSEK